MGTSAELYYYEKKVENKDLNISAWLFVAAVVIILILI